MVDEAAAVGSANDAVIATTEEERDAARIEAGKIAGQAALRASAENKVVSAQTAVEKARANVEAAEDALAQATAELEGLD
jgi:hypothetical protein